MSRRRSAIKRTVAPDFMYGCDIVTRFINCMMYEGKRSIAENIFYSALENITTKVNKPGIDVFNDAMSAVRPVVEVRPRRVGGATCQVPMEVEAARSIALAIRWLIKAARARTAYTMIDRLAAELLDAADNKGSAIKKREEVHKMAEANKAFAHYRW